LWERSILGTLGGSLLGSQSLFVTDFYARGGPGDVYLQTKNLREFVNWLSVLMTHR